MTPTHREQTAAEKWIAATEFWRGTGDPCPQCGAMSVGPVLVGGELVRRCVECGR